LENTNGGAEPLDTSKGTCASDSAIFTVSNLTIQPS
jgi:hypothetical protein